MRHLAALLLVACVTPESVPCSDGSVCPLATVCDTIHHACVAPAQATVCNELVDGDLCNADGRAGLCDHGICISGCGDGVQDTGEECDDANDASHDGCSSACLLEVPRWTQLGSEWRGRVGSVMAYDSTTQRVVVQGGNTRTGLDRSTWHRDKNGWVRESDGPAVAYAAIAETGSGGFVLFGGIDANGIPSDRTWRYAGGVWSEMQLAIHPSARFVAAMAYDRRRDVIVLYGGVSLDAPDGNVDTWELATNTWTKRTVTSPPARRNGAMAWDPRTQSVLLFGGTSGRADTWTFDGTTWIDMLPANSPPIRYEHQMSERHGHLVLFGGVRLDTGANLNDTWEWSGTTWEQLTLGTTPPARFSVGMAHDVASDTIVLAGGSDLSTTFEDVWVLDDDWAPSVVDVAPRGRMCSFTYDPVNGEMLLFGGDIPSVGIQGDTWTFDGAWKQFADAMPSDPTYPPARSTQANAYDPERGAIVMFGGSTPNNTPLDDTWLWNVATHEWSTLALTPRPSARVEATMAHDPIAHVDVLYGGCPTLQCATANADATWILDAAGWHEVPTPIALGARGGPGLVWDPRVQRIVMLGGYRDGGFADTWEFSAGTWTELPTRDHPPPRGGRTIVYDPMRDTVVLYEYPGGIWELVRDTAGATWTRVSIAGTVPDVDHHYAFAALANADPAHRSLVLFGGGGPTGSFDDTWFYRWSSATPDEDCANSSDDDGDSRVDCADPDCACP